MDGFLLVLIIVVVGAIGLLVWSSSRNSASRSAASLADAKADARRTIDRLGGQVINLSGTDDASKQALADASERFNAAGSQIDQATTARQAELAKESAMEGLYYVRAARTAMGMDPGPELETAVGSDGRLGSVTEDRRVDFEGRQIEASPTPSERTPNYYPGGRVAGRPVPAGWYSEPWWKPALVAGAWGVGSVLLFSALFSGMGGIGYDAQAFENGYGDGFQDGVGPGSGRRRLRRRKRRRRRERRLRRRRGHRWRLGIPAAAGNGWRRRFRWWRLRRVRLLEPALEPRRHPGLL